MSSNRKGIIAGGNFITDYVKVIDAWPEQDTLASIQSETMSNGGGPYNILKDLSRLDPNLPLEAIGLIGNDSNGDWIIDDCQKTHIDTAQLHRTDQAATSYTDAMSVEGTGRRTFFHQRGANALLDAGHFHFEKTKAKIFILGYLLLLDTLDEPADGKTKAAEVIANAKKSGLVTAVDCVSSPHPNFREITLAAAREADILFINEYEAGQCLGRDVSSSRKEMEEAATELSALTQALVILHTPEGAVAADHLGNLTSQASIALPSDYIKGATGAGDAFAAGFLLAIHEDLATAEALKYAVATAACSLSHPSPSDGMREISHCLDLIDQHGYRTFS